MSLEPSVLAKLRCPKSGAKLLPAPAHLLRRLGAESGFVSEDGNWFYAVEEGFPVLTADAATDLKSSTVSWDESYLSGATPWDKGEPAPPLTHFLEDAGAITGRAFVPGCGRGHDARALAKHGAQVTALDISPTAVAEAKTLAAHEGLSDIRFLVGDLFDLPSDLVGTFDWVLEHTCLSGLPPALRPDYFHAIASALRPGGNLLAIWFINPDMEPGESGPPFGISKDEVQSHIAGKFTLVREWIPETTFDGREGRELAQILTKI